MTDRDGRNEDSKTCRKTVLTRDFIVGRNLLSSANSDQDSVPLGQSNAPTVTNTDSDGDYETSSEGPQSPRPDYQRSETSVHQNVDGISNEISVKSTQLTEDRKPRVWNNVSYTILG